MDDNTNAEAHATCTLYDPTPGATRNESTNSLSPPRLTLLHQSSVTHTLPENPPTLYPGSKPRTQQKRPAQLPM